MKNLNYFLLPALLSILCFQACTKEEPGKDSQFSAKLNNKEWVADFTNCFNDVNVDSTISIHVFETGESIPDGLIFFRIPLLKGVHYIDSLNYGLFDNIKYSIFEEFDASINDYVIIPDGNSFINFKKMEPQNGSIELEFEFKMTVLGGNVRNNKYGENVTFTDGSLLFHF